MVRTPVGRPSKVRKKKGGVGGRSVTCGLCGEMGHQISTCRNPTDGEGNKVTTAAQNVERAGLVTTMIGAMGTTSIAGQ